MNGDAVDLIVIGGGIGGLSTAALAQARGLRVALLESHTKLGGVRATLRAVPTTSTLAQRHSWAFSRASRWRNCSRPWGWISKPSRPPATAFASPTAS